MKKLMAMLVLLLVLVGCSEEPKTRDRTDEMIHSKEEIDLTLAIDSIDVMHMIEDAVIYDKELKEYMITDYFDEYVGDDAIIFDELNEEEQSIVEVISRMSIKAMGEKYSEENFEEDKEDFLNKYKDETLTNE